MDYLSDGVISTAAPVIIGLGLVGIALYAATKFGIKGPEDS
jgi:hypothetical protein